MNAEHETPTLSFVGTVLGVEPPSEDDSDLLPVALRIDRLISGPEVLGDLTGVAVTLLVDPAIHSQAVEPGRRYRVDAVGASYGSRIVVRALSISPADSAELDADDFDRVARTRAAMTVAADVAAATIVVVGRITSLGPARPGPRLTEHDPALAPARIEVDEALKDDSPAAVDVLLPTSADVLWHQAPASRLGEPAIFFLERAVSQRAAASYDLIKVRPIQDLTAVRAAAGAH
jgi:hypothetical protein